jgi:hypothetical protein
LATVCVALSLALFALDGANSVGGFHLRTLSIGRPKPIMGPILDMVVISYVAIWGMMCEESGRRVNVYNALYCVLQRARCFASLVVTPRAMKTSGFPCAPLRPLTQSVIAFLASLSCEERVRRESENERETRDIISLAGLCSMQWGKLHH